MPDKAKYLIDKLKLQPHPEGGHFREVYRSDELVFKENLPKRYQGDRAFSTSIYFLLERGEISVFHRIKSDETWYFHDGDTMEIFMIDLKGNLHKKMLGPVIDEGNCLQLTIERGQWFAARSTGDYTLVGCNVSPGFDFSDFEMAYHSYLIRLYPQHKAIIDQFCH